MSDGKPFADAMAFYHKDGLTAAWKQAAKFAGKGGRMATLPDIITARLETKPGDMPWETYFTTLSAEYLGIGKSGQRVLIIAHGIGPMSTLDGITKAYSWQFNDKSRDRHGGRITQQEFLDLEAGKFGSVVIVDFEDYCRRYEYPFMQVLKYSEALSDPVLKARFGPQAMQYVEAHADHARAWHFEQSGADPENRYNQQGRDYEQYLDRRRKLHLQQSAKGSDPYIVTIDDMSNLCYTFGPEHGHREIEPGYAFASLLSIGRLGHVHHEGNESLSFDVSCHDWNDGTRLVGIRAGGSIKSGVNPGPDVYHLMRKHWSELLVPVLPPSIEKTVGFRGLIKVGDQWFTQCPKKGDGMDDWLPEYVVTALEPVGEPVQFKTTIGGYHGLFKYGLKEVEAIAPPSANAYNFVSDTEIVWDGGNPTHHIRMVQFFQITADTTKRLVRPDQLCYDYDTLMKLLKKDVK